MFFADFASDVVNERCQRNTGDLVAISGSDRPSRLHLLIAENDEVGGLEFTVVPDFFMMLLSESSSSTRTPASRKPSATLPA